MFSPSATRLTNALKAVLEPALIHARRQMQTATRHSALTGIFSPGCTLANMFENGSPSSLAKAQIRRDTEAKALKKAAKMTKRSMKRNRLVAARDPVAW